MKSVSAGRAPDVLGVHSVQLHDAPQQAVRTLVVQVHSGLERELLLWADGPNSHPRARSHGHTLQQENPSSFVWVGFEKENKELYADR